MEPAAPIEASTAVHINSLRCAVVVLCLEVWETRKEPQRHNGKSVVGEDLAMTY